MKQPDKKIIMLVDDNEIDNYINKSFLESRGISENIVVMGTVDKAIHYLNHIGDAEKIPHLVLLDINLPALSGFDFIRKFQSLPEVFKRKCKIVILSSSEKEDDMVQMVSNGLVRNYFVKPLSEQAIVEIKELLEA